VVINDHDDDHPIILRADKIKILEIKAHWTGGLACISGRPCYFEKSEAESYEVGKTYFAKKIDYVPGEYNRFGIALEPLNHADC